MPTSLAEQLKKLKTPQTSLLLQDKKRASLLFNPREAANYDRQTIFEIGIAGLEELKTLNSRFSEFECTLFDYASQSFERAVLSVDVNTKLNNNIRKFFYLLSPYFLLQPSHKVLEWLINRFHIHQYNVDDLLMLALPYHESKIFVRIIQLLDLSDQSNKWHWLQPLQKPGIPLSKSALFNHASSSPYFLKLLGETVISAVKEHGHYAGVLSSLLAFYCTTLLGMLERFGRGAPEFFMINVMNILLQGLKSGVVDFVAASYMIVGHLVTSTSLSPNVLKQMIKSIAKKHHTELKTEQVLLLSLIYQRQDIEEIPVRALSHLASQTDLAPSLGLLASKGVDAVAFMVVLIKEALKIIQSQIGDTSDMRSLVESILREVHFTKEGASRVIRTFIESFDVTELKQMKHKPLVVVGEWNTPEEVMSWYAKPLQQLERSYPSVFDDAVCEAIKKTSISSAQAAAVKKMLGFELQIDLFNKLHHSKSGIRAEALISLAKNCGNLKEKDKLALRDVLLQTLANDKAVVIVAVFAFPTNVLCNILGRESLRQALNKILLTHIIKPGDNSKWETVVFTVLSALTSLEKGSDKEEIETLLSVLPHVTLNAKCAKEVLMSRFASRNQFLKIVKKEIGKSEISESFITKALCSSFDKFEGLKWIEILLDLGKEFLLKDTKYEGFQASVFYHLLLLGSSLPNSASAELSFKVLQLTCDLLKNLDVSTASAVCKITPLTVCSCLEKTFFGQVPVECFLFVFKNIIQKTNLRVSDSWIDLQHQSTDVMLLVQLFHVILLGCTTEAAPSQSAYISLLHSFFTTYFQTPEKQIGFLSNLWTFHVVAAESKDFRENQSLEIQLRSLRLSSLILGKQNNLDWIFDSPDTNFTPALLIALTCPAAPIRKAALSVVKTVIDKCSFSPFFVLLQRINTSAKEIELDEEQLQLVLYTFLSQEHEVQSLLSKESCDASPVVLSRLLDCVLSDSTPSYVKASLLSSLTSVNDVDILEKLISMVIPSLSPEKDVFDWHCSVILRNVFYRINSQTIEIFKKDCLWVFIEKALSNHRTKVLLHENRYSCPAALACEQVTRELWEGIPSPQEDYHQRLLCLLISTGSESESPSVLSAVTHCIKQLSLDANLVVRELTKMKNANVGPAAGKLRTTAPSPQILDTKQWRCGLTLLELLQNKKKLQNIHVLLPILFELLKKCLQFEEQAPVEYAKQLLLSFILHCCQKLSREGTSVTSNILPADVLDVEAVVHCIRGTQNPQTHHHALLLLAHMAAMVPEQVLFNIMAIFTFMGTLVLRQDDAYSFQIISKIVDTIIPILIKASHSGTLPSHHGSQLEATVASVMRVFVDALLDVPEHRRLSLFSKLLSTLDPKEYLWLFLCLVIESHTVHHSESSTGGKRSRNTGVDAEAPKRMEVALQIATQFSPDIVLKNCVCLVQYLRSLPLDKILDEKQRRGKYDNQASSNLDRFRIKTLFDVEHHTPKQLRHYKYSIVIFLSTLLSSVPFVNQVASLEENGTLELEPIYRELIEDLLAFIQVSLRQYDIFMDTPSSKYWRVMVAQLYDILDKVNALLPSQLFLTVVGGLMKHDIPSLQRKAMELLNSRLASSRDAFIESCESKDLLALLKPLVQVVSSISDERMDHDGSEKINDELLLNQQTALLTIKYLSRQLAFENNKKFKPLLDHLSELIRTKRVSNCNLLASVVLCAAELCSALRAHAISTLPVLMPGLIELLATQAPTASEVVQISLAAATFRVVETLAYFLNPYLPSLLCALCSLSASFAAEKEDQGRAAHVVAKLKDTRQKLASAIAIRVLLPAVEKAYGELVKSSNFSAVGPLMSVLAESFTGLASPEISEMHTALTDFFLNALELRSSGACGTELEISGEQIDEVESHVVKALVALVLKMSESSFRPLYFRLFEWAVRHEKKERTITFYRLSCGIAECLKGLFVLFAGHFLKNAAELLDHCNVTKIGIKETDEPAGLESGKKHEELYFGSGEESEKKCAALVNHILKTLYNVFLYDSQNWLSRESFDALMQPLVDQLENTLGGIEELRKRAVDVLVPCLSQMAVACTDDTLWKQLNYQLLIKTRHQVPMVRLIALEAVTSMATKLGESFLPMLPETVPFLAELLEDEEEDIETACRKAVQDLEEVLGEPIQKYF